MAGFCRLSIFVDFSDDAAGAGDPVKWARIVGVDPRRPPPRRLVLSMRGHAD